MEQSNEPCELRAMRPAQLQMSPIVPETYETFDEEGNRCVVSEITPEPFAEDIAPWARQPGETDKAYAAWLTYRDTPPGKRVFNNGTHGYLQHYHRRYRWEERVQLYDRWRDSIIQQELAWRAMQARLSAADIGRDLREKAAEALSVLEPVRTERKVVKDDNGRRMIVESQVPNLSVSEIIRLAQLGVELERDAITGNVSGAPTVNIMSLASVTRVDFEDQKLVELANEIVAGRASDVIDAPVARRPNMDGK